MPDWSIKIEGKPAVFTPDIEPFKPGKPLTVVQGDIVSWNNESGEPHFPVPDNPAAFGNFMGSEVAPDNSSDGYNVVAVSGSNISYHCSLHPKERGLIVVVDFGAPDVDGSEDPIA